MDREKVIGALINGRVKAGRMGLNAIYIDFGIIDEIIALLKEQEAVEPKQGEWIYCEDVSGQDGFKCSECGFFEPWYYSFENHNFITDYAYCPSCGKPMQEGR